MGTVNVAFVFTSSSQFVKLNGASSLAYCTPQLVLVDGGNEVTISGAAGNTISIGGRNLTMYPSEGPATNPTTLSVARSKQPKFEFTVVTSAGAKSTDYALCGLALKKSGGGLDLNSFPGLSVSVSNGVTTLSVQDDDKTAGVTYDFWVLVQNSNGDIGIIDPLITNDA